VRNETSIQVALGIAALVVAGCGASTPPPAQTPAGAGEKAAPAPAADLTEEQSVTSGAPAPEAAAPPSSLHAEGAPRAPASDMEGLARQLENALTLSAPDCSTAWALRDKICDLAQRLCDMAGRSAEPEVAERCTDGRARCEKATTRVRAGCAD
jgi:hypothetical protein